MDSLHVKDDDVSIHLKPMSDSAGQTCSLAEKRCFLDLHHFTKYIVMLK